MACYQLARRDAEVQAGLSQLLWQCTAELNDEKVTKHQIIMFPPVKGANLASQAVINDSANNFMDVTWNLSTDSNKLGSAIHRAVFSA